MSAFYDISGNCVEACALGPEEDETRQKTVTYFLDRRHLVQEENTKKQNLHDYLKQEDGQFPTASNDVQPITSKNNPKTEPERCLVNIFKNFQA